MREKSGEIDNKSEDIIGSVCSIDFGAIFHVSLAQELFRNAFVVSIAFPERVSLGSKDFFMYPQSEVFLSFIEVSPRVPKSF